MSSRDDVPNPPRSPHPRHDIRLLPAALVCWFGTALGIVGGSVAATWMVSVLAAATVVVGLCTVIAARRRLSAAGPLGRGLPIATSLAAFLVIGVLCSLAIMMRVHAVEQNPVARAAVSGAWLSAQAVVREDPKILTSGGGPEMVLVRADMSRALVGGDTYDVGGRVIILAPRESWSDLLPGQLVTFRGKMSAPLRPDLTVAAVRVAGPPLARSTPDLMARWASVVREDLSGAAGEALSPGAAALLPALVVGDVSAVPKDMTDDFRTAGLSHLLAVSGANFSIVLGSVLLILRTIGTRPRVAAVAACVVLLAFVVIVRPSPSVLRAAAMGAIGLLALVTGRRKQALPALLTAVIGLLAWWPELAVDFGFALSVVATAALVLLAPVWTDWLESKGWRRTPAEILAVACAAHMATAPIIAAMAGTFSVAGVVANILVTPVVAPITVVGAAAAVIAPVNAFSAQVLLHVVTVPLWWLTDVAQRAADSPRASLTTPTGLPGAAVVVVAGCSVIVGMRWRAFRLSAAFTCGGGVVYWILRGTILG